LAMIIDHRYEVIESIGSGAWSNVYKVVDKRTGKLFTLKLYQYLSSADFYERFSAEEMHHITQIEHPNLGHITDFGHVGDHIYSLTEYYDGEPLSTYKFKKSQLEILYSIIVQITYALEALHVQDIIHKDLKPENVLYKIEGNKIDVKVIDYGFTKVDSGKDQQSVSGSLPYLAPEVYLNHKALPSSDYYSLGVMLYKLTTGSFPFSIEQINALITNTYHYFIPKFPSELNEDIPPALEKFILRLLEKNPEGRFQSASEIINYINRIQSKQYPFSIEWSMVNRMKFNSYLARANYSHQLLDYLDSAEKSNGKVVSVVGSEGMGKDNILSLFKYHLLTGKYFLFDYACNRKDHEPFFALIKEFMQSLNKEQISDLEKAAHISTKFSLYLFQSEEEAKKVSQSQKELMIDFESVKNLLAGLAEQKPIIFIVRNANYIHKYTIDFVNYISEFISGQRILILMSFDDYGKVGQITHSVIIQIPPLTYQETGEYVSKLLNANVNENFINKIYSVSAGNPYFIKEILLDLIQKKLIVQEGKLKLNYNFDDYHLPLKLVNVINVRLNHLTHRHYEYLKLLAVVECPLEKDLISYILKINDKALYDFINDAVYNEVLVKQPGYYAFVYLEAKTKLREENGKNVIQQVSKQVLSFYQKRNVTDISLCKGIIKNAIAAQDIPSERKYTFRLFELFDEMHDQDNAYQVILSVLKLDFELRQKLPLAQLIKDLMLFQEKTELTGICSFENDLLAKLKRLPPMFEKYYILGTIYFIREDLTSALSHFKKASEYIITGKQRVLTWLYFVHVYAQKNPDQMLEYLQLLSAENLPLELKIVYIDRMTVYLNLKDDTLKAIKVAEDFLTAMPSVQYTKVLLRLASLHNNIGVLYSSVKNIPEAKEHFDIALSIWERFNIKRYLGLIDNNLADLYLKQGITQQAQIYAQTGYELAAAQGLTAIMALALLNLGEANIKMGKFLAAEDYLLKAKALMEEIKSGKFQSAINVNLALAKSKIKNFQYYYDFINEQEPELKLGIIKEINPLVKTYFYYLFELGLPKKMKKLLSKNTHIDYHEIHEDEFYYNTLSMIAILTQDYGQALDYLKSAEKYAGEVNNHYAITVFYLSEIECYIGLRDYAKATMIVSKAMEIAQKYQYSYWISKLKYFKAVIDLADRQIPLRKIIRDLLAAYKESTSNSYYLITVKLSSLIISSLVALNADAEAEEWLAKHKILLQEVTKGIQNDDRENYLRLNGFYNKEAKDFLSDQIASRYQNIRNKWHELQAGFIRIHDADRIKFFIDKSLKELIAPWRYQLFLYSEKLNTYSLYLSENSKEDLSLSSNLYKYIERAFKIDALVTVEHEDAHLMIIPLQIRYQKIGFLIISDQGEAKFTKFELSLMRSIKQHLSGLIVRMQEYAEITQRIKMMNQLMNITHNLLKTMEIRTLETEIVSACIDFIGSSRGFLIKKDADGNNIYQVALDAQKVPLSNVAAISKTVLSYCQANKTFVSTFNALEDNRFKSSISVQDYKLHAIFCAPLLLDDRIYGFIYLDNFLDNTKSMYLDEELIKLLFDQLSVVLKNSIQYESLIQKSQELQSLESLKDEFMAIVSHELNTPLSALQGYVSRLKRNLFADEEERNDIISKIETAVKKLILTTNDIITMNNYNLKNELPMTKINIGEILTLIQHEIEIALRERKMFIKVEVPKDLPEIEGNWEALHIMIYNIALNAIRFTNDFGTIKIGARRSTFQDEKINNKETLVIYVQDNGIGMPPYQIKNAFRKFYELNEIYSHKSGTVEYRSGGLGLGLATAKRIAELHYGNIWIESKENEGTTVFIRLPLKQEK